jgi:hypothetical protein
MTNDLETLCEQVADAMPRLEADKSLSPMEKAFVDTLSGMMAEG